MKPYALRNIPPEDIGLFHSIRKAVENMPDLKDLGKNALGEPMELSCHMLARAVKKNFRCVNVRDGFYAEKFEHSWVTTGKGNVIDVYPVGSIGGPIMLDCSMGIYPGRKLFKSKPGFLKEECRRPEFVRAVRTVTKAMAQTMAQLGIL